MQIGVNESTPEVLLGHSSAGNDAGLHKVLERHVVNALGGEHHVGTCIEHLLDALFGNVAFPISDLFQLLWVLYQHLIHPSMEPFMLVKSPDVIGMSNVSLESPANSHRHNVT